MLLGWIRSNTPANVGVYIYKLQFLVLSSGGCDGKEDDLLMNHKYVGAVFSFGMYCFPLLPPQCFEMVMLLY